MPPKRLLLISGRLAVGGAERFVSTLLTDLDRTRVTPSLCLLEDRIEYPLPNDVHSYILRSAKDWHYLSKINHIRSAILEFQPDIILSNIALTNRLTGMALNGIKQRPQWIARIGNHPGKGGRSQIRNLLNRIWNSYAYYGANCFITNSHGLKNGLEATHGFARGKTFVFYNPIDFQAIARQADVKASLEKPSNKRLIITAGRLHRQKRHDTLLTAFAHIRKKIPAELWICGDGYLRPQLEKIIQEQNMAEDVRLLGHQENPFALFRLADLFLFTSDWEGMPNALIEAMSLGIPVVSTDCPYGPGEIIRDGVDGMLVPCGDIEKIADTAIVLLNHPDRLAIGKNGAKKVTAMFDKTMLMEKWTSFFEQLLSTQ